MNKSIKPTVLEDAVRLLVKHFGVRKVRVALDQVSEPNDNRATVKRKQVIAAGEKPPRSGTLKSLERYYESDRRKYILLTDFLSQLNSRTVLKDSQDIRHFAQQVGLKEIRGKSRKEMIPALMRFLLEQPTGQLEASLRSAQTISEANREQGFSLLTDKLLGEKNRPR